MVDSTANPRHADHYVLFCDLLGHYIVRWHILLFLLQYGSGYASLIDHDALLSHKDITSCCMAPFPQDDFFSMDGPSNCLATCFCAVLCIMAIVRPLSTSDTRDIMVASIFEMLNSKINLDTDRKLQVVILEQITYTC